MLKKCEFGRIKSRINSGNVNGMNEWNWRLTATTTQPISQTKKKLTKPLTIVKLFFKFLEETYI